MALISQLRHWFRNATICHVDYAPNFNILYLKNFFAFLLVCMYFVNVEFCAFLSFILCLFVLILFNLSICIKNSIKLKDKRTVRPEIRLNKNKTSAPQIFITHQALVRSQCRGSNRSIKARADAAFTCLGYVQAIPQVALARKGFCSLHILRPVIPARFL